MNDLKKLTNQNVVLTGADGFIGSHLAEALVGVNANVTALCQYNSFGTRGWIDTLEDHVVEKMEIIFGDVRDVGFIAGLIKNRDLVFNLAALIGIPYSYLAPRSYTEVNVFGTLNILEACRQNEGVRLIHTSTSEVYGTAITTPISETHPLQAQSPYSASKIAADHMVTAYHNTFGLNAAILRPFNTFGPRQSERAVIPTIIRQLLDENCDSVKLGSLTPIRDFNYVSNTVDAFLHLAICESAKHGDVYNAGTGVGVTIENIVAVLQDMCGVRKPIETVTTRERPEKSEVHELVADSSKLKNITSWQPAISLNTGLNRTVDWWKQSVSYRQLSGSSNYVI